MAKAGGIIGLIGGIFGILAAILTLLFGSMGAALEAEGANMVVGLGMGGILFSFLCIIFGAIVISNSSKIAGFLLTASSVGGIVLGGTIVAIFMILSLIGGVLSLIGSRKK